MNPPRPRRWPVLLLAGLSHLVVLHCFLQSQRLPRTPRAPRDAMLWLLPAPVAPGPRVPAAAPARDNIASAAALSPPGPRRAASVRADHPVATSALPAPGRDPDSGPFAAASPAADGATGPAALPADPFAQPASPAARADRLLARTQIDAGKIDQELRKTFPVAEPLPPPDGMLAKLRRGFDAAHEAVPPKWYQGARMVELGGPDGPNKSRTYKIITALGTYCINISPEGRRSYSNCPR